MHRRDSEEAPVAGGHERLPRVLREQERARQEERDERVPPLLRKLRDRRDVLEAGVRHHGVEAAEPLERCVDHSAVPLTCREVAVVDVDPVDRPAVRFKLADDRRADPAGRAGDESGPHVRKRKTSSATQTGFSPPSRSIVAAIRACSPPDTSSTSSTRKLARTRLPTGTGAGKRTRLTP